MDTIARVGLSVVGVKEKLVMKVENYAHSYIFRLPVGLCWSYVTNDKDPDLLEGPILSSASSKSSWKPCGELCFL